MAAYAEFRGTYILMLKNQVMRHDHGLSDSQGDSLPGWDAHGAHVRTIGAAQIFDLDARAM